MLVLSRKIDEAVLLGDCVVRVVEIRGDKVRLGFEAPGETPIHREELMDIPEIARLHGLPCAAVPHRTTQPAA